MANFTADGEFSKLLGGRSDVDLVRLMLELAADRYPSLDRVQCLMELDRLGVLCSSQPALSDPSATTAEKLSAISYVLYEVEGFHGNREHYYDPRNSYLNEVLQRRTGIPISLGILYAAVAARAGVRVFGVNTPGHFVVGARAGHDVLFVDPFNGGEILDAETCRLRVEKVLGQCGVVHSEHLRPAPARDIVARMLRNLKAAFALEHDWQGAVAVQSRLAALLPSAEEEQRDLGLILLRAGQPNKALPLLERCACGAQAERAENAEVLLASLRTARKLAAEMN